jgi:hypothetical protein
MFLDGSSKNKCANQKKAALLPNEANTSPAGMIPSKGWRIIIRRPVTTSGIGSVTQRIAAITSMPIMICPSCDNPCGLGRIYDKKTMKIDNNIKKIDVLFGRNTSSFRLIWSRISLFFIRGDVASIIRFTK